MSETTEGDGMWVTTTTTVTFKIPEEYETLQKFEQDNKESLATAKKRTSTGVVVLEIVKMFEIGGDTK